MKVLRRVLISILWFFIPCTIQVLLSYAEITLGALFTCLLYAPFLALLSKTWHGKFDRAAPPAIPPEEPDLSDGNASVEPTVDTSGASQETVKPQKRRFGRYDTYIACPSCGQIVPKNTATCECGFVFRKSRNWRKIGRRVADVCLVILLLYAVAFAGYRYGVDSMAPELEAQYDAGCEIGYKSGETAGYDAGYKKGYKNGKTVGYDAGYSAALSDHTVTIQKPILNKFNHLEMPRLSKK